MKKKVLFLCTHNACRSQMAEGFLNNRAGDRFEVVSAGSQPAEVHPLAVRVMEEIGIDISGQQAKSVMDFIDEGFDYVITLCDHARKVCPAFPGNYEKIHWDLEDPAKAEGTEEDKLAVFRQVRNRIGENIRKFIKSAAGLESGKHSSQESRKPGKSS